MSNQERLLEIQNRILRKEEVTPEEYSEIIAALREDRRAGANTKAGASKTPIDLDTIFELD
jgi:hypothetical protein